MTMTILSITFWMEGVLMPTISFFGLIGNIISIYILRNNHIRLDLHPSFTNLCICLAVFDSLFLITSNSVFAVQAAIWPQQCYLHVMAIPYLVPLTNIAMTGSVYTVVAISVERYTTIKQITKKPLEDKFLVCIIVFFSVAYNFVKFFELDITSFELNINNTNISKVVYYVNGTWLRKHPVYSLNYIMIGNFFVMNLLPLLILTVCNYFIYKTVSRSRMVRATRHRRDRTMSVLLLTIVMVFIICNMARVACNLYEAGQMYNYGEIKEWPPWIDGLTRLNHVLLAFNSSINIVIYTAKDFKFRQALVNLWCCKTSANMRQSSGCSGRSRSKRDESSSSSGHANSLAMVSTAVPDILSMSNNVDAVKAGCSIDTQDSTVLWIVLTLGSDMWHLSTSSSHPVMVLFWENVRCEKKLLNID